MPRQYNKQISYEYIKLKKRLNPLTYRDFLIFRKKFIGNFIYKGKKSFSIKNFHYIILNLKKLKKKKNPMKIFFYIIKEATPFLTIGLKKIKRSLIQVPSLLYGNKKNVLLCKWIIKQVKGKSNIYGVKKQDVLKNLLDIYKLKGSVLKLKRQHNDKVILTRINLKNEGIKFASKKDYNELQKQDYLQLKDDAWRAEIDRLNLPLELDDDEIEEEFELWKQIERNYKQNKMLKFTMHKMRKKNKKYLNIFKKSFVK